jgi:hypothetical protein
MTQAIRRPRRGTTPIAVEHFRDNIDKALAAFGQDVTYSVLMARAAVTIARKREVWQIRREHREVLLDAA